MNATTHRVTFHGKENYLPRKEIVKPGVATHDSVEFAARGGFLSPHTRLARQLDDELQQAHALSLAAYDVLLHLGRVRRTGMPMSTLAEAVRFSPGGVSKLVARLENEALVRREPDPADRRAALAAITDAGLARLEAARTTHLSGIRRLYLDHLTRDELVTLGAIWQRLLAGPGGTTEPPGPGAGDADSAT